MINVKEDGTLILSVSDEDMEDLKWDERILLELEHDGEGWTIQQASCNTVKFIK